MVAGKTSAMSFLVNAATREQPTEWTTGIASGVAASFMHQERVLNTEELLLEENIIQIQKRIEKYAPLNWKIKGNYYPPK
jgi:hypothetical protein